MAWKLIPWWCEAYRKHFWQSIYLSFQERNTGVPFIIIPENDISIYEIVHCKSSPILAHLRLHEQGWIQCFTYVCFACVPYCENWNFSKFLNRILCVCHCYINHDFVCFTQWLSVVLLFMKSLLRLLDLLSIVTTFLYAPYDVRPPVPAWSLALLHRTPSTVAWPVSWYWGLLRGFRCLCFPMYLCGWKCVQFLS